MGRCRGGGPPPTQKGHSMTVLCHRCTRLVNVPEGMRPDLVYHLCRRPGEKPSRSQVRPLPTYEATTREEARTAEWAKSKLARPAGGDDEGGRR